MKFGFQSKKLEKNYIVEIEPALLNVYDGNKKILESRQDMDLSTIINFLRLYEVDMLEPKRRLDGQKIRT